MRPLLALATICHLIALDLELSGTWDIQGIPAGGWQTTVTPGDTWQPARIPAARWDTERGGDLQDGDGVWLRRSFHLTPGQAAQQAALCWELVRWGFAARLNGTDVGETLLYMPDSRMVPAGVLRPGANELLLKVRCWPSVPRGSSGEVLYPIGSARFSWGNRDAFVLGPIGLDLHGGARLRAALIDGDPATGRVQARLRCDPAWPVPPGAQAELTVRGPDGLVLGVGVATDADTVTATCPGLPAWSPTTPVRCTAEVVLRAADGTELDRRSERFGARVLSVHDGLLLDGRRLPLFGSNAVHEWLRMDDDGLRRFLVDDARQMHCGGFRTHTLPPTTAVADLCDAAGTWLLAEMPPTYNGRDTGLGADEEALWRQRAEQMITRWCEHLHNHPSIVGWVPVNEPPMDGAHDLQGWIHGTLVPAVRQAAPNRPVLSAWGSTADADDIHIYAGFWQGAEGEFREVAAYHAAARVPGRILANTEYIEGLNPGRIFRWSGLDAWTPEAELRYAWIGADQTEILRLLRYDLVLPYWFANWNRRKDPWRADAPTPMFAALKSALAPVGVVLDLEDRNHAAGSVLETTVVVMNDSDAPVQTRLRVVLATSDPQWDPQAVAGEPVLERTVSLPPHSRERVPVSVRLPAQEVERVLVAQVGPAISTRPLRSVAPPTPSGLRVRVLGASPTAIDDLRRLGLDARAGVAPGRVSIDADRLLVWEDARLEASTLAATGQINRWVQGGGRLVVLAQRDWQDDNSWTAFPATAARELFRFTTSIDPSSTIWPVGDPAWWQGLPRAWCDGWNGGDLAITDRALNASWLPGRAPVAQTPHGWVPEATAAAARILPIGDAQHAFPADEPDRRFFATDGSRHRFSHLRTQPLLLCTRQPAPEGGWALRLPVTAAAAATSRLLVFEHGRAGSSPFRWRIDGGAWQESPASSNEAVRVHAASNVWFGWTDLGVVTLSGGAQVLEVRVERPCADGVFRLAWDDLLLAPPPRGQVLAVNGSRRPVLVQVPVDRGQAIFCQLRIADRLDPARSGWDPVAGRLLLHLLGR